MLSIIFVSLARHFYCVKLIIMENIKKGTPKDVFLHLLAVVTLYVSVVAFIALWWQYINILFPDLLKYQNYYGGNYAGYSETLRMAMSALMVVFPIHILISWLIGREFKSDPEKREVRVRKWLWYITLFISAVTIIIDLVILVNNFLKGELTMQFFLKVLVVLVVAAAVLGYYLLDLRRSVSRSRTPRLIAWITAGVVLASIIYGFFLVGLPSTQRARGFDERRVSDLSVIQSEIISYWQQKGSLPPSLDSLRSSINGFVPPVDPETAQPYDYVTGGPLSFKLCAVFKTSNAGSPNSEGMMRSMPVVPGSYYPYQQNWSHGAGLTCFDRMIDPQLYKRTNNGEPVPLKY